MKIDLAPYYDLVDKKYLTVRRHPNYNLLIWNYTNRCQFENYWNDVTMSSRGLVTTEEGEIVARPFKKFLNIEQHVGDIPLEEFKVTEKADGSLGIVFVYEKQLIVATRGSFESDQAKHANDLINKKYKDYNFDPNFTYLFEIIYPENRIVVNYGDFDDLILLTIVEKETGYEKEIFSSDYPFPIIKMYDGLKDIHKLKDLQEKNKEGFVLHFKNGLRLKFKFDEYKRLHKILTGVNELTIWELLKNGDDFDTLLDKVPDEFYAWVNETKNNLLLQYTEIENQALCLLEKIKRFSTRKEQAIFIKNEKYAAVVFQMLDNKNYSETIWKNIRPVLLKSFKEDKEQ